MRPTYLAITALGLSAVLYGCSTVAYLQEPRVVPPGSSALSTGIWAGTQTGYEANPQNDNVANNSTALELLFSGRLGLTKDYDMGASFMMSSSYAFAFGIDIKRQLFNTENTASALSVGSYYLRNFNTAGMLNATWSFGSKFFVFQTQARFIAGREIVPRYGANVGIALRISLDSSEYSAALFGIIGGIDSGGREEFILGYTIKPVVAWVRFGVQYFYLNKWLRFF